MNLGQLPQKIAPLYSFSLHLDLVVDTKTVIRQGVEFYGQSMRAMCSRFQMRTIRTRRHVRLMISGIF